MKAKHILSELETIATRLRLDIGNMIAPSGQSYVRQWRDAAKTSAGKIGTTPHLMNTKG